MKKNNFLKWCVNLIGKNMGVFIFLLFFSILQGGSVVFVSILMKLFLDSATVTAAMSLSFCVVLAIITLLVLGIAQVMTSKLQGKLFGNIELGMRGAIVEKLYAVRLLQFDSNPGDFYFMRLTKDVETIAEFFSNTLLCSIFFECLTFMMSMILMFILEWRIAVVLIIIVPLLIFLMIKVSPRIELFSRLIMQNEENNRNILQDFLNHYILFKSYGMKEFVTNQINESYKHKRKSINGLSITKGLSGFLNNFLGIGMFIITLAFGSFLIAKGETTVGTLVAVVNLVSFYYGPFLHVSGWIASINSVKVSANRIEEIMNMETEQCENDASDAKKNKSSVEDVKMEAYDISFSYNESKTILNELEFTASKGEIIAVVGENGSGKSTFLKILMGFYQPDQGHVRVEIDGTAYEGTQLRNHIAYDPSDVSLFTGNLQENICMNSIFNMERLNQAARYAKLDQFIEEKGIQYELDSYGKNLSSGQKRKVSLARIFYSERNILILDEPTANLDEQSIEEFWSSVEKMRESKICIIVTHDQAIISRCNRVFRLTDKKLVEEVKTV